MEGDGHLTGRGAKGGMAIPSTRDSHTERIPAAVDPSFLRSGRATTHDRQIGHAARDGSSPAD